jgi:hypothetical protein
MALVYNTMLPRNAPPKTLPDLMNKFRDAPRIHEFVKAQLAVGARFSMIMLQICYPKLDMTKIVRRCQAKLTRRRRNIDKINDVVTPVAEEMMDELFRLDAEFFMRGSYGDHRVNIDSLIGDN